MEYDNKEKEIYRMNRFCLLLAILVCLAGCSAKSPAEKRENARVLMNDSVDSRGLQLMQTSKDEQSVSLKGKEYRYSIVRAPSDSLPHVKSEMGDTYLDNVITLRITQDNKPVFSKRFTKHSFSSLVPADFLSKSILEGMVFDKVTAQGMVFALSVSYPQTDLYLPLSLTVSPDGKMSVRKEELLEEIYTGGDDSL